MKSQFKKRTIDEVKTLGTPYDPCSVMQYRKDTFGRGFGCYRTKRNRLRCQSKAVTMERINAPNNECELGKSDKLSKIDIYRVNKLYDCPGRDRNPRFRTDANGKDPMEQDHRCTDQTPLCVMWASAGDCEFEETKELCPFSCNSCQESINSSIMYD